MEFKLITLPRLVFLLVLFTSHNLSALTMSVFESLPLNIVHSKMLKEIYERAEIPLDFVAIPAERSLSQSTRGIIDGEVVRLHKIGDLYPTLIRVPTSYTSFETSAFSMTQSIQEEIQQDGWNALENYRVGVVRGMKYAEFGLSDTTDIVVLNSAEQLFKMLELNRLDIAITSKVSGLSLINRFDMQSVHLLSPALQRNDLYHYLHEKNKQYIPLLDETI